MLNAHGILLLYKFCFFSQYIYEYICSSMESVLEEVVDWGIHSFIIDMNVCFHVLHVLSMLFVFCKNDQSAASISCLPY